VSAEGGEPAGSIARSVGAGTSRGLRSPGLLAAGTCTRILLAPVAAALVLGGDKTAAVIVFVVAAATDYIDGRLARRWNVASRLGSFLDTTADKLLVTAGLFALVAVDRASPWLAIVIVGRELMLLGLRAAVAAEGRHIEPSLLGKWKATAQFGAIALAIARPDVTIAGAYLDEWVMALAAFVTVWSAVEYFARFSPLLRDPPQG
jgi:CDP-diacylglycerol---glycerol-3-phosphate 3-phosphatidyltransferase